MTQKALLQVAAIENGTVIDHIPSEKLFDVVRLLHLEQMPHSITVGYNLKSHKMGRKSIIKISGKFFTDAELNILAVAVPNVTLVIIRDYEIVDKKTVTLPDTLLDIVQCPNPQCITNNEPMRTRFRVLNPAIGLVRCDYCNRETNLNKVSVK
ncbi:MAG: aspartate carbamoyltransferase regulatory subunit [Bacteroidaceae bacterium]|nr:aspartate carbamoyltransferase regulatory subunit [Bacteroidaceae bacterium]